MFLNNIEQTDSKLCFCSTHAKPSIVRDISHSTIIKTELFPQDIFLSLWEWDKTKPDDLYLDLCDWPLWRRWPCWWRSGGSRSRLPPWVKNGRCSAACGEWRHPTLAWSSHATGNTPTGGEEEKKRIVATESERSVNMSRGDGWRETERRKTPNGDTNTMTGQKAILLANSCAGWMTGETKRDAVI